MKRFRIKLVGFGLAALAGSAHAADDGWRAAGQPPASVAPAGTQPAVLPLSVRAGAPRPGVDPDEALWLPATSRAEPLRAITPPPPPAPMTVVPAQFPEALPAQPLNNRRFLRRAQLGGIAWPVIGPRVGSVPQPLPTGVTQPVVADRDTRLAVQPPRELPPPREVTHPRPSNAPTQPPPMPKPVPPPAKYLPDVPSSDRPGVLPACPVAPPELMVPEGAVTPGKHGTFGSPPMRLSRDYSRLADLCGRGGPAGWRTNRDGDGLERGFVQAEYLLWWMNSLDIPILGTTNTRGGFGFLGEPGTVPVVGPGEFIGTFRHGFRACAGLWLDDHGSCGIDGSFFFLGRRTAETVLTSQTFPITTRPIFSPNPNVPGGVIIGQTGEAVTVPGILTGSLVVEAESELWGFDVNLRKCLSRCCDRRTMWFAGYRNVNLSEELTITENINVIGNGMGRVLITDPIGSVVVVQDRFATDNHFHGGQIGLTHERRWGRLSLDARASVALGVTRQELDISGFQTRTQPGQPPMTFRGGLLAAGPNLGSFTRNSFSVVPEFTLNAGVWLTPTLKVYAGYNFLYWTNVLRPGDQIDPVVDLTNVPNAPAVPPGAPNRPAALFNQSNLWVTGAQVGLEWRW